MKKQRSRKCGECVYFFKINHDQECQGICDLLDASTKTDHSCKHWKQKPKYNRKNVSMAELVDALVLETSG